MQLRLIRLTRLRICNRVSLFFFANIFWHRGVKMAKNKAALILKQHPWVLKLAKRRAEEVGARPPFEVSIHKGFEVEIPNISDLYAWMLDEVGRQESELGMEAQCWQDKTTKKKMTTWLENFSQIVENLNDVVMIVKMMTMAGIRLPETLPWNEEGSSEIDLEAITAQVVAELEEESQESSEVPEEDQLV